MSLATAAHRLISGVSVTLFFSLLFFVKSVQAVPQVQAHEGFVGSERCAQCHQEENKQWQTSHHAKSMMPPTSESVLGDFNNKDVTFKDVKTRFTQDEKGYFITTQNASSEQQTYKVQYTFGYTPLQQYLIDIGDGKLQAFDVAWDSRPTEEGGQRWFKLLSTEETGPDDPFHWTRQQQNWNSRCAECHSTKLDKGYDPIYRRYNTTFTEANVACESCHGAGEKHVSLVSKGGYERGTKSGFGSDLKQTLQFVFDANSTVNAGNSIAKPVGEKTSAQINACGGCHSRRQVIGEIDPANDYHDQYALRLIDDPLYHPDGQIEDEVFVLGSFLQSKMHKAGVTCTNCHNAHTGEVKVQDNSLCTQCHKVETYDAEKHHHHKKASQGALCVNCHMPSTTYMDVDDRRDHSLSIPGQQHSKELKTPNACNSCHKAQSNQWAATAIQRWNDTPSTDVFGLVNARARQSDVLALRPMVNYIDDENNTAIRRATLLSLSGTIPSRLTAETIIKQFKSESPLVRSAAVEASGFIPLQQRATMLMPLITDPSATVRYAVANQLAGYAQHVQGDDYTQLSKLLREYETQLKLSQDMPGGQASIALYALNQGDTEGALNALNKALEIEPDFVPALLNLADLYRGMGDEVKTKQTLDRGIKAAPDSSAIQHSYGLYWVRQGSLDNALPYLKTATEIEPSSSRYFYVYAVAQESNGQIDGAISTLEKANGMWPNQYDLLLTTIMYLEKAGRDKESWAYLTKLSAIAPNDPEVKRRVGAMRN